MIKHVGEYSFIQHIKGKDVEHSYDSVEIKNNSIVLPQVDNAIEVLFLNNKDDEHSKLVTKIFAKVASLNK
jgi:hypothetical protein